MTGAELQSIAALVAFTEKFPEFTARSNAEIDDLIERAAFDLKSAEHYLETCLIEVREAEEALQSSEEPSDAESDGLEVAYRRARQASEYVDRLRTAFLSLQRTTAELKNRLARSFDRATAYLEERVETARNYENITVSPRTGARPPGGTRPAPSPAPAPSTVAGPAKARVSESGLLEDLSALPANMEWISMTDINWDEVPEDLEFKDVPRDSVRTMMETFSNKLLPIVSRQGPLDREKLQAIDDERALADRFPDPFDSTRLSVAYDCMIGRDGASDVIVLDVDPRSGNPKFGVTSGRHRLLIAKELGWTHVPARVLGRRRR